VDEALMARVDALAASRAPLDLVVAAVTVADDVANEADALVVHFVERARQAGCSWTEVGERLGVSKQAVRKRWGDRVDKPLLPRRSRLARCIEQAAQEATADGSAEITTMHLLLGLQREGMAAAALRELKVSDDRLRSAVRARLGPSRPPRDEAPPSSAEMTSALAAAAEFARQRGAPEVGTEHVLFVLGVDRGAPTQLVLDDVGVGIRDMKRALESCLGPGSGKRGRRRGRRRCYASCSFCGKSETGGVTLVAGPNVWICDACVDLSRDILDQRQPR
jgi:hypothetical protein